jgi:protoheme IX farnesyltransferase
VSFVTLSCAAFAAEGRIDPNVGIAIFLVVLLSGGALGSFNAYLDKNMDRFIPRKGFRPVASGVIAPINALTFGVILCATAMFLSLVFFPSVIVIGTIIVSTLVLYTYLKRKTALSMVISSLINGVGVPTFAWFASIGYLTSEAFVVMVVLTFWTLNHLIVITLTYMDEYAAIKRPTIPARYGWENSAKLAFAFTLAMVVAALFLPTISRLLGLTYWLLMLPLSAAVVTFNAGMLKFKSVKFARNSYRASRIFVAVFFLSLALDSLV